jgi:hypothetical protein
LARVHSSLKPNWTASNGLPFPFYYESEILKYIVFSRLTIVWMEEISIAADSEVGAITGHGTTPLRA